MKNGNFKEVGDVSVNCLNPVPCLDVSLDPTSTLRGADFKYLILKVQILNPFELN